MNLLALECSTDERSIAIWSQDRVVAERVHRGGRSTPLFELLGATLADASLELTAIETIAVGLGPGSYTGIRSTLAAVQGWALARTVRVVGISSVDAAAWQAQRQGLRGRIGIAVDALRGEFYAAEFEVNSGDLHVVSPLRLLPRAELQGRLAAGGAWMGPEFPLLGMAGIRLLPTAAALAELAVRRGCSGSGTLEPIYLRATTFVKAPPIRPDLPSA